MLMQRLNAPARGLGGKPHLIVIIDTEEAFDWSKPHSRAETDVGHIRHHGRAQRIFDRYGVKPTYVVDYPVAAQEEGYRALKECAMDGRCEIGAHLHPWVNPPFEEELSVRNSFPGNLPPALERAKLMSLTARIEESFGHRPATYRAGRFGIGEATAPILAELGYAIDTSVVPRTSFAASEGPDFSVYGADPFWFGPAHSILELPATVGWCGGIRGAGERLQSVVFSPVAQRLHIPGVLARCGLFERIRLTPEGAEFEELKRLVDTMLRDGTQLFSLTFHSPSLVSGNTPYVRDESELRQFLDRIERFCDFFFGPCGGAASTPSDIRKALMAEQGAPKRTKAVL